MKDEQNQPPIPEPNLLQMELIGQFYALRRKYQPAYTWQVQDELMRQPHYIKQVVGSKEVDFESFMKKITYLFDKVNASFYHLTRMKEGESEVISIGKRYVELINGSESANYSSILGISYEVINYEYESMLITLKSALDILALALAEILGFKADNIGALVNSCLQSKKKDKLIIDLQKLFMSDNSQFVFNEFKNTDLRKSKRNFATHYGSLPTGTVGISFNGNGTETDITMMRAMDVDASMESFERQEILVSYTENLFYIVSDLILDSLSVVLERNISRGLRASVYEEQLSKI